MEGVGRGGGNATRPHSAPSGTVCTWGGDGGGGGQLRGGHVRCWVSWCTVTCPRATPRAPSCTIAGPRAPHVTPCTIMGPRAPLHVLVQCCVRHRAPLCVLVHHCGSSCTSCDPVHHYGSLCTIICPRAPLCVLVHHYVSLCTSCDPAHHCASSCNTVHAIVHHYVSSCTL